MVSAVSIAPIPLQRSAVQEAQRGRVWPNAVWVGLLVSALMLAFTYSYAATHLTGQLTFHLFWVSAFIFLVPAFLRLCGSTVPRSERLAIVAAIGLFNYIPKFLRTPDAPLFHDELAHWRSSELTYQTGHLFQPNPTVYISQFFPGLQAMTVALRDLTGLSTWQLAGILVCLVHVMALLGVFLLAERFMHTAQAAGIAAFIYSLNPGFMYFDSQYSYESIAIVFVIWVIVAAINLQDAVGSRPRQVAWFTTGLILAGTCIVTHHLSSYVMTVILWVITAVSWLRVARGSEVPINARLITIFTIIVTTGGAAWLVVVAPQVLAYLSQPASYALAELAAIVRHQEASRTLFAASTTPKYEHLAAFASPAFAFIGAAFGLLILRRARPRSSVGVAMILFGLLYFPSIPVMLTASGAEGARRSWSFTYLGLCMLLTPVIIWLLRWAAPHGRRIVGLSAVSVAAVLSVMLVGNVTMHVNEFYRFPGAYVYGSDTRSTTDELLKAVAWYRETQGAGNYMVTDRYTGLEFSSFGMSWTSRVGGNFPVWELYFQRTMPSQLLLNALETDHYRYMVVDERMSTYLPYLQVYFERDEPDAVIRTAPVDKMAIDKFVNLPWTIKIYQSPNLAIYRFNFSALQVSWRPPSVARAVKPAHVGGAR